MDEDSRRFQEQRLRRQAGLCGWYVHVRVLVSDKGSVFGQCGPGLTNPAFLKYPQLPVLRCAGWMEAPSTAPAER